MSLMERLLKTLRYNFLTEALDFVGVHQERTLQVRGCLHRRGGSFGVKRVLCHSWGRWVWSLGLSSGGLSMPSFLRRSKYSAGSLASQSAEGRERSRVRILVVPLSHFLSCHLSIWGPGTFPLHRRAGVGMSGPSAIPILP